MRRPSRSGPPGQGRFGCILWAVALGLAVLVAWKAVPVKLADVELADFIEQQVQFAGGSTDEQIRKRILQRAKELDIPLDPKNLEIKKGSQRIQLHCTYSVELDFSVYTYVWNFEHEFDRPIFII